MQSATHDDIRGINHVLVDLLLNRNFTQNTSTDMTKQDKPENANYHKNIKGNSATLKPRGDQVKRKGVWRGRDIYPSRHE